MYHNTFPEDYFQSCNEILFFISKYVLSYNDLIMLIVHIELRKNINNFNSSAARHQSILIFFIDMAQNGTATGRRCWFYTVYPFLSLDGTCTIWRVANDALAFYKLLYCLWYIQQPRRVSLFSVDYMKLRRYTKFGFF